MAFFVLPKTKSRSASCSQEILPILCCFVLVFNLSLVVNPSLEPYEAQRTPQTPFNKLVLSKQSEAASRHWPKHKLTKRCGNTQQTAAAFAFSALWTRLGHPRVRLLLSASTQEIATILSSFVITFEGHEGGLFGLGMSWVIFTSQKGYITSSHRQLIN